MNLKQISLWLLILLFISTAAASAQQVTKEDIRALEQKMSNLETTVNAMDKRLISLEITVQEMDRRLTAQIQAVHVRIDELDKRLNIAMSILVGVVLTAIALSQLLGYLIGRHERQELQQQLRDQRTEIQQQIQNLRTETQQQIQDLRAEMRELRAEMRDLGDRIDRQIQVVLEKLSQQQQEIDALKARRIMTS